MEKIWAKDVKEGEQLKSVFLVARKAMPTAKSGKAYLSVTFHDKTGELEGRAFDGLEPLAAAFEEKDFVEVEGHVGAFQGKPQLRIETATKVDPAGLDGAEFLWVAPPEVKKLEKVAEKVERGGEGDAQLWQELQALTDAVVDPFVKILIRSFLDDEDVAARLRRAPAAKTIHHAYPGGLLEHTVSALKLAHRLADHYPQVDRDLLVAGAFFHDLGKIRELTLEKGTEYTDEGRLIGHHVLTAQWIHEKARRNGIPRELETQIVHLVLAHHGKMEYGSPRPPATLEALLTHYIDEIDSRVNSWLNLMGKEGGSRRWTDAQNVYNQHIWRGALPTIQGEKPGPAAEVMTPVIYVPHSGQPHQSRSDRNKKAKPARAERRPDARSPEQEEQQGVKAEPRPEGEPKTAEGQEARTSPEHAPRPERPHGDRPHADRGPRGPGGPGGGSSRPGGFGAPGGAGGPGDRKPRSMGPGGPRLQSDRAPPVKPKNLTYNPFAALAAKLAGVVGGEERAPEEQPVEAVTESAPETVHETASQTAQQTAPEPQSEPQSEAAPVTQAAPTESSATPSTSTEDEPR